MNKTTATAINEGIANGEMFVGHDRGDAVILGMYNVIEQHLTLVGPNGETLSPASPTRRNKDIAFAQGAIAAYRTATEF